MEVGFLQLLSGQRWRNPSRLPESIRRRLLVGRRCSLRLPTTRTLRPASPGACEGRIEAFKLSRRSPRPLPHLLLQVQPAAPTPGRGQAVEKPCPARDLPSLLALRPHRRQPSAPSIFRPSLGASPYPGPLPAPQPRAQSPSKAPGLFLASVAGGERTSSKLAHGRLGQILLFVSKGGIGSVPDRVWDTEGRGKVEKQQACAF